MFYKVRARYIPSAMPELSRRLTDGSIESQKPDGPEIVASMRRARITAPGVVEWSEQCLCPTPLAHERETVYDRFFTHLHAEPADGYVEFEGEDFMAFLRGQSA